MNNNSFDEHLREIENKKDELYRELTLRIIHTNDIADLVEEIKDDYYDDHCIYETLIENMLVMIIIGRTIEDIKWLGIEDSKETDIITQTLKEYLTILKEKYIEKFRDIERSDIDEGMKKMIYESCDRKVRKAIRNGTMLIKEALEY